MKAKENRRMKILERDKSFLGELMFASHQFPKGPATLHTGWESGMSYTDGLSLGREQQGMCLSCGASKIGWKLARPQKKGYIFPHGIDC